MFYLSVAVITEALKSLFLLWGGGGGGVKPSLYFIKFFDFFVFLVLEFWDSRLSSHQQCFVLSVR